MVTSRAPRSRSGRVRRGTAMIVGVLLVAGLSAACTPRLGEFVITNETDQLLLIWDEEIPPGVSERVRFDDALACFKQLELVTADLAMQVVVDQKLCDGDRVTVAREDLVPVHDRASVRNASSTDILVTFDGGPGVDEWRLAPGEQTSLALVGAIDGCSDERLLARIPDPYDRDTVLYHAGPLCRGQEWVVDDDLVAAGAAQLTVVNETDLTFRISSLGLPDEDSWLRSMIGPGQSRSLDLGVARGLCLDDAEVRLRTEEPDPRDDLQTWTTELCDGSTWVIAWEDLEGFDPQRDRWVAGFTASMRVVNGSMDSSVRLTVDGEDRALLAPGRSEEVYIGARHEACADLAVALWAHPQDGSSEPLIAAGEVCDGDVLRVGSQEGLHRDGEVITDPGS